MKRVVPAVLSLLSLVPFAWASSNCNDWLLASAHHQAALTGGMDPRVGAVWQRFLSRVEGKSPHDRLGVLYSLDVSAFRQTLVDVKAMIPAQQYRMQKALHALTSFNPVEALAKKGITRTAGGYDDALYTVLREMPEYAALENVELATLARHMSLFSAKTVVAGGSILGSYLHMVEIYRHALEQLARLDEDLDRAITQKKITYFEYLDLTFRFVHHASPAQDRDRHLLDTAKEHQSLFTTFEDQYFSKNPYLMILPMTGDLSRADINALSSGGMAVLVVGLIDGLPRVSADGTPYSTGEVPYDTLWGSLARFADHDLDNHGKRLFGEGWVQNLNQFLSPYGQEIDLRDPYSKISLKRLKLALTYQSLVKKTYFETYRNSLKGDDQKIFDYLWFEIDHEIFGSCRLPVFNHQGQAAYDTSEKNLKVRVMTIKDRHWVANMLADTFMKHFGPKSKEFTEKIAALDLKAGKDPYPSEAPDLKEISRARIKRVYLGFYSFAKEFSQTNPEENDPEFQRLLAELRATAR